MPRCFRGGVYHWGTERRMVLLGRYSLFLFAEAVYFSEASSDCKKHCKQHKLTANEPGGIRYKKEAWFGCREPNAHR